MTTTLAPATCPRCGTVATIFIRSEDGSDLLCWGDAVSSTCPKSEEPSQSPRQLFGSGADESRQGLNGAVGGRKVARGTAAKATATMKGLHGLIQVLPEGANPSRGLSGLAAPSRRSVGRIT